MTLWLKSKSGDFGTWPTNCNISPAPSVMGGGIGGRGHGQYYLHDDGKESMKPDPNKPPYRVPTMKQIRKVKPNGYKVVSTFSGCGGSCTGYRMAGFQVLWANEFVPAAQESYKANAAPDCILDPRDIRQVTAAEILKATKLKKGELDLFDGSPPCQAFSTAGKREKGWGTLKTYEHGAKQKNEDLFFEYIRLLDGLQPKVFIAENVSGLVKGTAKGYFLEILAGLKACGYNVKAKLLDAQWLGVPQQRQRIIFVGVRNDLKLDPAFPAPLKYRYSVRDALPDIQSVRLGGHGYTKEKVYSGDKPSPKIMATGMPSYDYDVRVTHNEGGKWSKGDITNSPAVTVRSQRAGTMFIESEDEKPCRSVTSDDSFGSRGIVKRKFTIAELKRICAFPDDFILTGSYAQQWERLGNSVPPVMMYHIANTVRREILDKVNA